MENEIKVNEYMSRKEYTKKYNSDVGYSLLVQNNIKRDDIVALKLKEYKLLEILTKEQFESISYKVERN